MLEFLVARPNIPFAVVLALLIAFFFIELAGLVVGTSVSGMLGDVDLPDVDVAVDFSPDLDVGVATKFLYWLKIGRVPLLILIVIFMAAFVVCGYALQFVVFWLLGALMSAWLAAPAALVLSVPVVRYCGGALARILPHDETAAISHDDLVGGSAFIVLGTARKDSPAQARSTDKFGTTHYVMVEPDNPDDVLESGKEILLVRRQGSKFYAIAHPGLPSAE